MREKTKEVVEESYKDRKWKENRKKENEMCLEKQIDIVIIELSSKDSFCPKKVATTYVCFASLLKYCFHLTILSH